MTHAESAGALKERIAAVREYWEMQIPTLPEHIRKAREILLANLEKAGETVLAYATMSVAEKRKWSILVSAAKYILRLHGIKVVFRNPTKRRTK